MIPDLSSNNAKVPGSSPGSVTHIFSFLLSSDFTFPDGLRDPKNNPPQEAHYGTICHPCSSNKGKYATLGTHYAAQGLDYAVRGPWGARCSPRLSALGLNMSPRGRIKPIIPWAERGGIIYQSPSKVKTRATLSDRDGCLLNFLVYRQSYVILISYHSENNRTRRVGDDYICTHTRYNYAT